MDANEINVLDKSASSFDLSNIENLWEITKNKLEKSGSKVIKEKKKYFFLNMG